MTYRVEIDPHAERQIRRLRGALAARVARAILALADNPRPPGCLKMSGWERRWRIRVGDYRVVYDIFDDRLLVVVVEVDHRRDAYRRR